MLNLVLCPSSAKDMLPSNHLPIQLTSILLQLWMGWRTVLRHPSDSPKSQMWEEWNRRPDLESSC
jgi:hypothetical protein